VHDPDRRWVALVGWANVVPEGLEFAACEAGGTQRRLATSSQPGVRVRFAERETSRQGVENGAAAGANIPSESESGPDGVDGIRTTGRNAGFRAAHMLQRGELHVGGIVQRQLNETKLRASAGGRADGQQDQQEIRPRSKEKRYAPTDYGRRR
jgi:hypothetical protein